jgi:hypothetical protein
MVLLTWTVYLTNGERICVKEIDKGSTGFGMMRMITCNGKVVLIPPSNILKIVEN